MTFQQLQYLLEINRANSIRKAAANLFVAPSSISACVNSLEEELGFPIFIRTQKGLITTPQGQSILDYAGRICKIYAQMCAVRNDTPMPLHIGCFDYAPPCIAFARLMEELTDRKDLSVSMTSHSQEGTIQKLVACDLDLAIISNITISAQILEEKLMEAELEWRVLKTIPYAICVGPTHRLYNKESVTTRDIDQELLIDSAGKVYSNILLSPFMKAKPEQILPTGNPTARRELVMRGLGYSIELLPPKSVRDADSLHYIPIEGLDAQFCLVTNPRNPLSPPAERFIALLEEELEKI